MALSNQITGNGGGLPFELTLESISESSKYIRSKDIERVTQFNADVKAWANNVTSKLKASVKSMVKTQ